MSERTRIEQIADARAVLDWLENHPEVELPYDFRYGFLIAGINTKDELATLARAFGESEKEFVDDGFYLRKRFGGTQLYAYTARQEVCERVVVGTEEVPERVIPASTREVVEWRCHEPLLNGGDNGHS